MYQREVRSFLEELPEHVQSTRELLLLQLREQYVQLPDHAANAYRRIAASVTESMCKGLSDESPAGFL